MKRLAILLFLLAPAAAWGQPAARPMTVDDLFRFKRLADPQISPDGKWVAYAVGTVDMENNRVVYNLWLASTEKPGLRKQLTSAKKSDRHPRWTPDGKAILFESSRSGTSQLWLIDIEGGEARQLTKISTGANTAIWSRDGKQIAFVSAVWPEFSEKPFTESDALNQKRMDEREKNPVKARVFTRLFFRHWDEYVEDKRQHLFVVAFDGAARRHARATLLPATAMPTRPPPPSRSATISLSAPTASSSTSRPCRRRTRPGAPITTFAGSRSPAARPSGKA